MDEHVGDLDTSTERVDDKAPERIWLQIGNWHYSIDDSGDLPTYCDEKIDDDDVEYVLATALEASQQQAAAAQAKTKQWQARCKEEAGRVISHAKKITDLRKQLAAAQAENTAIEEFIAEHGTIRRTYK